jgi:hypothetical protein
VALLTRAAAPPESDTGIAAPNKAATVKIWALFGVLAIAFETYVLLKWVTGPNFEHVPAGPTPVPTGIKVAATTVTVLGFPAMLWFFWNWVGKPWRRSKTVTAEGLLLIWFATFAWFLDPFANYFNAFFTYNAWLPNMGSWVADVPGWSSITAGEPGRMQAYPLLFVITAYVWGLFGVIMFLTWSMRQMRARWPRMSTPTLVFLSYWNGFFTFLALEIVYMRCGIYGYHSAVPELTLWHGEYYQMPIYEAIYAGFWCLGYSCLMYFRNDKGQTLVERGIERVRTGKVGQLGLRFAAMTAICTAIYMVSYNIPYWITNNLNAAWPKAAQENSYWTNYICGPETNQACPSPDLPITKRNSGHFDPSGTFIVRDGRPSPADADQVTQFATD